MISLAQESGAIGLREINRVVGRNDGVLDAASALRNRDSRKRALKESKVSLLPNSSFVGGLLEVFGLFFYFFLHFPHRNAVLKELNKDDFEFSMENKTIIISNHAIRDIATNQRDARLSIDMTHGVTDEDLFVTLVLMRDAVSTHFYIAFAGNYFDDLLGAM